MIEGGKRGGIIGREKYAADKEGKGSRVGRAAGEGTGEPDEWMMENSKRGTSQF
jgi:hypothetical protein